MTSPTQGNSMDAITALLAERQRYEGWIATLETRRASTPPHVYSRVRADYEKRLTAVLDQLAGRSSELESVVSGLATRVSELMQDENSKRDERAEAELRAAVGEFTPEQWEELSQRSAAEISRLEAQRNDVGSELAQVQELLLQATRKSDAITPPESAPAVAAAAPPAPQAAAPQPAAPPPAPSRPAPDFVPPPPTRLPGVGRPESVPASFGSRRPETHSPDFDELAFLKSVVDHPREGAGAGAGSAPRAAAPPPLPRPAEDFSALVAGARESAANYGAPSSSASRPPLPGLDRSSPTSQPTESPSDFPSPDRDRMSKSVPAFLRDVPAEQVKTLKCQECGTMNYPTEWYCERCGGELAAM